eukprot:14461450-Alexandrium_andersonii.AAC.1
MFLLLLLLLLLLRFVLVEVAQCGVNPPALRCDCMHWARSSQRVAGASVAAGAVAGAVAFWRPPCGLLAARSVQR